MWKRLLGAAGCILLLTGASVRTGALEVGRQSTLQFYAGDLGGLWDQLAMPLRKTFGNPAGLRAFRRKVLTDFGEEQRVISESLVPFGAGHVYVRTATFSHWGGAIELRWSFDASGRAVTFQIHPSSTEAPTMYREYETKTHLRLPFTGTWSVLWGGRVVSENRHSVSADMRFAYDFLVTRNDSSHEGDGSRREQYFCWGRPVVSPGDGLVVEVENGIPDNVPGQVYPDKLYGNHILIDHGNGEVSLLAHLQRGSVRVHRGEAVTQGQLLAKCGNSGNSTEPHLHYQLMTGRKYLKAYGLPAQFESYFADGHLVPRGEPRRGQIVEPQDASRARED